MNEVAKKTEIDRVVRRLWEIAQRTKCRVSIQVRPDGRMTLWAERERDGTTAYCARADMAEGAHDQAPHEAIGEAVQWAGGRF